jgi:hypothetical protein
MLILIRETGSCWRWALVLCTFTARQATKTGEGLIHQALTYSHYATLSLAAVSQHLSALITANTISFRICSASLTVDDAWTFRRTRDGVQAGGERLAREVMSVASCIPSLRKISFVGNSLGGLYSRSVPIPMHRYTQSPKSGRRGASRQACPVRRCQERNVGSGANPGASMSPTPSESQSTR